MSEQERCPTGWVSVEERLPTEEGWYLTFDRYETTQTMFYGKSVSQRDGFTIMGELQDVTHWMPLPSAPSSVAEQPSREGEIVRVRNYWKQRVQELEGALRKLCDACNDLMKYVQIEHHIPLNNVKHFVAEAESLLPKEQTK